MLTLLLFGNPSFRSQQNKKKSIKKYFLLPSISNFILVSFA